MEGILKWILRNRVGGCRLDSSGSGQGPVAGSCAFGNEQFGSIRGGGEFLHYMNDCQFLKKDSTPWS
jgi:hypothetical protein